MEHRGNLGHSGNLEHWGNLEHRGNLEHSGNLEHRGNLGHSGNLEHRGNLELIALISPIIEPLIRVNCRFHLLRWVIQYSKTLLCSSMSTIPRHLFKITQAFQVTNLTL